MIDEHKFIQEVGKVLKGESDFYIKTKEQLNKCVDHIYQLITDSFTLYSNKAYSSSVFLAIAVIEEVAKVHMGWYIKPSGSYKKKDKLRDHKTKEIIGASYTICMGERIQRAIAKDKLEEIFEMIYSGKLKNLREKSIYCEFDGKYIVSPNDIIDKEFSKNMLLFAIESFDDNLVGYTDYTMEISKKTDMLFERIVEE